MYSENVKFISTTIGNNQIKRSSDLLSPKKKSLKLIKYSLNIIRDIVEHYFGNVEFNTIETMFPLLIIIG